MTDRQWKELAFLVLFPKGKFGHAIEREVKLSQVKYFNARLLYYLFFTQFITEQKKMVIFQRVLNSLLTYYALPSPRPHDYPYP